MKKYLLLLCVLLGIHGTGYTQIPSASQILEHDDPDALWIWSATGSQPYIEEFISTFHPEIVFELDTVPFDMLQTFLNDPDTYSGPWPDIILGEEKTLQLLQERNMALSLDTQVTAEQLSRLVPYTVNLGRAEDGLLYGLMYAVTPVTVCYRRSMARKYLGTDDPEIVGAFFASWEALIDTARRIRLASGGEAWLSPGIGDIEILLYASKDTPWIVNGRLNIDMTLISQVSKFRECVNEQLVGDAEIWSNAWFAEMTDAGKTLAFFLPLWGYEYVVKPNTGDAGADWALCAGPVHRFWGAQIFSILNNSSRVDVAVHFLRTICLSPDYELWLNDRIPEVPAHRDALDMIAGIGGAPVSAENPGMTVYREVALQIDGCRGSSIDLEISGIFAKALKPYYSNTVSLDEALWAFRSAIHEQFPEITQE